MYRLYCMSATLLKSTSTFHTLYFMLATLLDEKCALLSLNKINSKIIPNPFHKAIER